MYKNKSRKVVEEGNFKVNVACKAHHLLYKQIYLGGENSKLSNFLQAKFYVQHTCTRSHTHTTKNADNKHHTCMPTWLICRWYYLIADIDDMVSSLH